MSEDPDRRIILLDPAEQDGAYAEYARPGVLVWYFASTYRHLLDLRMTAPGLRFVETSSLSSLGEDLAVPIANLSEQLFPSGPPDWWDACNTAERSSYTSSLSISIVRLVMLKQRLDEAESHLVFTDDAGLRDAIRCLAAENGLKLWEPDRKQPMIRQILARSFSKALQWMRAKPLFALRMIGNWLYLRGLRHLRKRPIPTLKEGATLILTWWGLNDIPAQGHSGQDTIHGRIPQVLGENGHDVTMVPLLVDWIYPFKALAQSILRSEEEVVLLLDLVTPWDIVRCVWQILFAGLRRDAVARIQGVNVLPLIKASLRKDHLNPRWPLMLLHGALGRRLAKGPKPRLIMLPHEHQPWERCLSRELHKADILVVAHQHSPFPRSLHSVHASRDEIRRGAAADRVLLQGEYERQRHLSFGFPSEGLYVVGAWRFETAMNSGPLATPQGRKLLACASIEFDETFELLHKSAQVADGGLLVTFHPICSRQFREDMQCILRNVLSDEVFSRIRFLDIRTSEALSDSHAMVYNATGAAIMAVTSGVPAIYLRSDLRLDSNTLPDSASLVADSGEGLAVLLKRLSVPDIRDSVARQSLDALLGALSPPDQDALLASVS